jgi:hypothetical protein
MSRTGNEQCVQDGYIAAAGCPVQRRLPVAADEARVDVGAGLHEGGHRGGRTGEVTGPVGDRTQQGPRRTVVAHPHSGQGRHAVEEPTQPVDASGVDRLDRRGGERIVHRQRRGQCPSFVRTHRRKIAQKWPDLHECGSGGVARAGWPGRGRPSDRARISVRSSRRTGLPGSLLHPIAIARPPSLVTARHDIDSVEEPCGPVKDLANNVRVAGVPM